MMGQIEINRLQLQAIITRLLKGELGCRNIGDSFVWYDHENPRSNWKLLGLWVKNGNIGPLAFNMAYDRIIPRLQAEYRLV